MTQHWKTNTDDDGTVWICIDKADASANVLSSEVLIELDGILEPLEKNPPRGVVFYSGKPGSFVMGADIKEFVGIDSAELAYDLVRQGQQLFDRIENLPCRTVAAINGVCLGGGLELVMACVDGSAGSTTVAWSDQSAVNVVLAAKGYPDAPVKGDAITGLDHPDNDSVVFQAGTTTKGTNTTTAGGRVLSVVGLGRDLNEARDAAYARATTIDFAGKQYRTDIAT